MKKTLMPLLVVPILLTIVGTIASLAVKHSWNFELTAFGIFLITFIYIQVFERILPLKQEWKNPKNEYVVDLKHLFLSTLIFDAAGKTLGIAIALYVKETFFDTVNLWNHFPFFITFIMANVIGEFLPYWYHKISHTGNPNSFFSLFLWKTHSIHHIPTGLNWFKTNWIHPINIFFNTILKFLPLLILGFSSEIIFLTGVTHVVIAYLSHANIATRTGWLDYLVVTPKLHQFHHSTKLEEAKNYGNILPFWDLLFGTYYKHTQHVENVGISSDDSAKYPERLNFWKQMSFPFSSVISECCKNAENSVVGNEK